MRTKTTKPYPNYHLSYNGDGFEITTWPRRIPIDDAITMASQILSIANMFTSQLTFEHRKGLARVLLAETHCRRQSEITERYDTGEITVDEAHLNTIADGQHPLKARVQARSVT